MFFVNTFFKNTYICTVKATRDLKNLNATLLADFILQHYGSMSHLKLQKLLYYVEAYHLAYFGKPVVKENFEAWVHGPVCREVYNSLRDKSLLYAELGFEKESNPAKIIQSELTEDQITLIHDVLSELSQWTGFELESATHKELPWIEARRGYGPADRCDVIISKDTMRDFYKSEMNA